MSPRYHLLSYLIGRPSAEWFFCNFWPMEWIIGKYVNLSILLSDPLYLKLPFTIHFIKINYNSRDSHLPVKNPPPTRETRCPSFVYYWVTKRLFCVSDFLILLRSTWRGLIKLCTNAANWNLLNKLYQQLDQPFSNPTKTQGMRTQALRVLSDTVFFLARNNTKIHLQRI